MGRLFYENKNCFKIIVSCIWPDRRLPSASGIPGIQFDLGLAPVSAGIVAVYVISCLAGGFMAGKIMRKDKCFWGILVGLAYFILLVLVSFAAEGKWDMSFQHLLTTFCMCLGGGALGGMLA